MESWQRTVNTVSDRIFPGISQIQNSDSLKLNGNEVIANLPLQVVLYFNVVLFPIWCLTIFALLDTKYFNLSGIYQVILITVLVSTIMIEIIRLYLGYSGNLAENIPDLAGFWMLSLLLQCPLQTFLLLNPNFKFHIAEIALQSIMVIFLVLQLIFGYFALKRAADHQAKLFMLKQLFVDNVMSDQTKKTY